jgi:hypothetical protein
MSMEQNEPQVSQGQQGPPAVPASAAAEGHTAPSQNSQQQRRRRRRRNKNGRTAAPPDGQAPAQIQVQVQQGEHSPDPSAASARQQPSPQHSQDREQARDQDQGKDQRQAPSRDGVWQDPSRDPRARQGGKQQHGKKQQRHFKSGGGGGGSSQGRNFQKAPQPQPQPVREVRESNPGNGIGQQVGGSYRKQQKVRRAAPSFVGPMDHSYRAVNGNIADGSPSTMDYRSNTINGNGNGNVHGRNGYSDAEYAMPVLLREDAPVRIICFIEELFVVAKMQETARKLGVKVSFVKAEKDTVARIMDLPEAERPSLIVFDLNNVNAKPLTLIPKLKAKLKRATSIIGFLSHIQGDLKMKAIEAGCDSVMPKAAFSQNLPNLLRRHGLDEELEALEV